MGKQVFRYKLATVLFASPFVALWIAAAGAATVQDALSNLRNLSPVQRKAVIEENARKEKDLVWYTSMGLTDFPKIVDAFEKAVPYVKVKANRLTQSTILTKIDTEARAGLFRCRCRGIGAGRDLGVETKRLFGPLLVSRTQSLPYGFL